MALTKVQIDGVEFSDSTDLNVDNGTLVVDATNNRVGVGISSPKRLLHLNGGSETVKIQITNTATGSSTDGEGFQIGIATDGTANIEQRENADLAFFTNNTPRLHIKSDGKVGLGTSSPDRLLELNGDRTAWIRLESNRGGAGQDEFIGGIEFFGNDSSGPGAGNKGKIEVQTGNADGSGGQMLFFTGSSSTNDVERMRIDSSGRVGIGTTSPDANSLLDVNGVINIADGNALAWGGGFSRPAIIGSNVDDNIKFNINGFEACRLDSSRRLLVGTSTSASYGAATGLFQVLGTTDAHIALKRTTDNGSQGTFTFAKSRGTVGAQTIVNSGDALGSIRFAGYDGVDYNTNAAEILCAVDGTPGANDMPGRLVFSTTADGDSSPTERMRITQSGHLKITDNTQFSNVTGAYNEINYAGSSASLLLFSRNASPSGYYYQSINADPNNTSQYAFRALQNTGVNVYTIWSNGTVSARSDARYKKNIETTRDGYLEDLSQLRVVKYNWYNHEDNAPKELGLIAQEVEEVFPGLVLTEPAQDAEGNETGEVCKSIKYSVFTPMLVKALQEAHTRIEQLEARLAALEAN